MAVRTQERGGMDVARRLDLEGSNVDPVRPRSVTIRPRPDEAGVRPRTILLVDDEEDILESLAFILRNTLGAANVFTASSGRAALLHMNGRRLGAILSDYHMPGMDGFEFIAKARLLDPNVPVIMMTAHPGAEILVRAKKEFGIPILLIKPFPVKHMLAVMTAALGGTAWPAQPGR